VPIRPLTAIQGVAHGSKSGGREQTFEKGTRSYVAGNFFDQEDSDGQIFDLSD